MGFNHLNEFVGYKSDTNYLGCFVTTPTSKREPTPVELRAYLDQLIVIRKQTPAQLSTYFKLDFNSKDPDIMKACIGKLRDDINYQYAHKSGGVTQSAPAPPWEPSAPQSKLSEVLGALTGIGDTKIQCPHGCEFFGTRREIQKHLLDFHRQKSNL